MLYAKSTKNIKKCFCTLKASSHKLPQLAICYTLQIPDVNIFPPVYLCVFSSDDAQDETRRDQEKLDLVELLEAVTYLVCQDQHVIPDTFYKVSITLLSIKSWEIFDNIWMRCGSQCLQIWSSRGVVTKLMRCIDKDGDDTTTVEEFMSFIIVITNPL